MTIKARAVRMLLRLYPRPRRAEYGDELEALLLARPLDARTVGDVVANGIGASLRNPSPPIACALIAMVFVLFSATNGMRDPRVLDGIARLLTDSGKLLPTTVVAPFSGGAYALLMIACGCWTELRDHRSWRAGVRAVVVATLLAGLPFIVVALSMAAGVSHAAAPLPPRATWVAIALSPLFAAVQAWIWGIVGVWLAGRLPRRARARVST